MKMVSQNFKTSTISSSSHLLTLVLFSLLLILITNVQTTSASSSSSDNYKTYVKKACNSTLYAKHCYKSLSPYASKIELDPKKLCKYSLYVALVSTRGALSTATKISNTKGLTKAEVEVIADCRDNIQDSADELQQCWDAVDNLNGATTKSDEKLQMDNVKTWASAALTDDDTCTDDIDEEKVSPSMKSKFRKSVVKVARSASIVLAIINGYCSY